MAIEVLHEVKFCVRTQWLAPKVQIQLIPLRLLALVIKMTDSGNQVWENFKLWNFSQLAIYSVSSRDKLIQILINFFII